MSVKPVGHVGGVRLLWEVPWTTCVSGDTGPTGTDVVATATAEPPGDVGGRR